LPIANTVCPVSKSSELPKLADVKFFASIFNNARPLFFAIVGILLFVYFCWGGFDFLTSMGDAKKAESGKSKITHAIIGFVIIFAAYWILQITDAIFGFGVYSK
jgi:hypothetical protein